MHTAVVVPGFNLRAFGISPGWVPDFSNGLGHRFCAAFCCPKIKSGSPVSPTSFATVGLNRGAFILTISGILGLGADAVC